MPSSAREVPQQRGPGLAALMPPPKDNPYLTLLTWPTLAAITPASLSEWQAGRLGQVTRKTVRKERAALAGFLIWCHQRKYLPQLPVLPALPAKHAGTRAVKRKTRAQVLPPEQIASFLRALPDKSPRKGFVVRAFLEFLWETAMRASMAHRLILGVHWRRGWKELAIDDAIDKNGFGRSLPLSPRALELLERHAAEPGKPIWTRHDLRDFIKAAAKVAGIPLDTALALSAYDLRASQATHWVRKGGSLTGAGYLLGHKSLATTALYARGAAEDAAELVRGGEDKRKRAVTPEGNDPSAPLPSDAQRGRPLWTGLWTVSAVRRGGLEPPRFYPLEPEARRHARFCGFLGVGRCTRRHLNAPPGNVLDNCPLQKPAILRAAQMFSGSILTLLPT